MTSLDAKSHPYVQVRSESPSSLFTVSIHFLLIYLSIYGLISIYVDNIVIRSLKDVGMVLISLFALTRVYRQQIAFLNPFLFILASIIVLGALNVLMGSSVVTLIYGIKITFLPLVMLFAGMLTAQYGGIYAFARTNLIIFIMLIAGWLIQYALGIEKLITMGFVYGVNIKNYLEGVPRLSSITYSPDGYAYALLMTGIIAERTKAAVNHRSFRIGIQLLTISFLLLSTIRSALLLWFVYQVVMFFLHIRKYSKKNTLILAVTFMLLPGAVFFGGRMLQSKNLLSITSLLDRLQTWGSSLTSPFTMNGVIGNGIGSVGAASRRTHMMGLNSSNFAVDNQYFSLYEQTGWIGLVYFSILFMWIVVSLVKRMNTLPDSNGLRLPQVALSLGAGVAAASLTTNVLELFPANVFFWMVMGMALYQYREADDIPYKAGELK
ncbi:O-antigen ligase family protein [Paenibacillus sp. NPDC056933]|uniref:O-antigen ligase family protein n=1 Tax=Paenibacillus sp. NPDC056933 TaxID=3345968 RepID=UPI00362E4568